MIRIWLKIKKRLPLRAHSKFSSFQIQLSMFAIVTIAGQQFKVEEGQEIFVHQLEAAEGDSLSFDQVLLVERDGQTSVGTPVLNAAKVNATVVSGHVKGDKVIIFKKKRRKGYRLKKGHRQHFTKLKIDSIVA